MLVISSLARLFPEEEREDELLEERVSLLLADDVADDLREPRVPSVLAADGSLSVEGVIFPPIIKAAARVISQAKGIIRRFICV